ncbi:uncharacterized protein A4U43_C04F26480 [Asparagus officinalis]|uniref:Uncharacterized protein n=1 Tax=Asparagus officinalis TaxID=4686 RepID=A0A5P1F6K2_ASPOF|nr:uncharacterized protein A4U43_C04F26480 [Asparagus officinalis]
MTETRLAFISISKEVSSEGSVSLFESHLSSSSSSSFNSFEVGEFFGGDKPCNETRKGTIYMRFWREVNNGIHTGGRVLEGGSPFEQGGCVLNREVAGSGSKSNKEDEKEVEKAMRQIVGLDWG